MKKLFTFLLTFVMAATFAACSAQEEQPLPTTEETKPTATVEEEKPATTTKEEKPIATIEAKNCFGNAGYVEFIAGAEKAADYTFTAEHSDAVNWRVYVLDEAFEEGFRYISQAAEPVLTGDGTVSVAEGQFVYVYCSVNEFTTDAADETAKLIVTVE